MESNALEKSVNKSVVSVPFAHVSLMINRFAESEELWIDFSENFWFFLWILSTSGQIGLRSKALLTLAALEIRVKSLKYNTWLIYVFCFKNYLFYKNRLFEKKKWKMNNKSIVIHFKCFFFITALHLFKSAILLLIPLVIILCFICVITFDLLMNHPTKK